MLHSHWTSSDEYTTRLGASSRSCNVQPLDSAGRLFQTVGLEPCVPKIQMATEILQISRVTDAASQNVPDAKVRWLAVHRSHL